MKKLEWSPNFEIGSEEIDDDHRRLVGLVQDIHEAIEKNDLMLCVGLANKFLGELSDHFDREEALLERVGYPNTEGHKKYHASLLAEARELKRLCSEKDGVEKLGECYAAMVAVLVDDIIRGDSMFKSYLEHSGHRAPRKPKDR